MPNFVKKLLSKDLPRQTQSEKDGSFSAFYDQRFQEIYAYVDSDFVQKQIDEAGVHLKTLENQSFFDYEKLCILDIANNIDKVDIGEKFRMLEVMSSNINQYEFPDKYKPLLQNFIDHLINNEPMNFKAIAEMNACIHAVFVAKMAMLQIILTLYTGNNHYLATGYFKMKLVQRYEETSLRNQAN